MAFDPALLLQASDVLRHGYGPVLLAGAEIILKNYTFEMNDSSVHWLKNERDD